MEETGGIAICDPFFSIILDIRVADNKVSGKKVTEKILPRK